MLLRAQIVPNPGYWFWVSPWHASPQNGGTRSGLFAALRDGQRSRADVDHLLGSAKRPRRRGLPRLVRNRPRIVLGAGGRGERVERHVEQSRRPHDLLLHPAVLRPVTRATQ